MNIKEKIEVRLNEIQQMMKSGNREGIQEKIADVAKFWSALKEEDRDFLNAVRLAVEEDLPWK